jgi:hypothetical protein
MRAGSRFSARAVFVLGVILCIAAGGIAAYANLAGGSATGKRQQAAALDRAHPLVYSHSRSANDLPSAFLDRATEVLKLKPQTIENVGNFTDAEGRVHSIYLAEATNGDSCMLQNVTGGVPSAGTPSAPTGGGCRPAKIAAPPLRWSAHYAGSPDASTGMIVVGVANPSVQHVRIVDGDGRSHAVGLNSHYAFLFESHGGGSSPRSITAYGANGERLARMALTG